MANRLQSAHSIRNALKEKGAWDVIKSLDPKPATRREHRGAASYFKKQTGLSTSVCAVCGHDEVSDASRRIEMAHIVSVQLGGGSDFMNQIPLCAPVGRSLEQRLAREDGCHRLFDRGHCSINEMLSHREEIAKQGELFANKKLRGLLVERGTRFASPENPTTNAFRRLAARERNRLGASDPIVRGSLIPKGFTVNSKHLNLIKFTRRQSGRGSLLRASRYLDRCIVANIPNELKSWAYYEFGYVRAMRCEYDWAADLFEISEQAASSPMRKSQSAYMKLHCCLAGKLIEATAFIDEVANLISVYENVDKFAIDSPYERGTAQHNIALLESHCARIESSLGKSIAAKKRLKRAGDIWDNLSTANGFSPITRVYIPGRIGFRLAHLAVDCRSSGKWCEATSIALNAAPRLCRSIVGLVSHQRGACEEIRDYLVALGMCFDFFLSDQIQSNKNDQVCFARQMVQSPGFLDNYNNVVGRVIDGISLIYPTPQNVR